MAEIFSPAVSIPSKNTGVKRKRPTEKVPTVRAVLANLNLAVISIPAGDVPVPPPAHLTLLGVHHLVADKGRGLADAAVTSAALGKVAVARLSGRDGGREAAGRERGRALSVRSGLRRRILPAGGA